MPSAHSDIVGGSTAKRVINCPGSVALCAEMPKQISSSYADEGTLCHDVVADYLDKGITPQSQLGRVYEAQTLTQDLLDDKIMVALDMLETLDPDNEMDMAVESEVGFGDFLPGVFGSADVLGRIGDTAYVIDWKFGRGIVDATENYQMLFYAAAAMRTPDVSWVFEGVDRIVMAICQPEQGEPSVWETTPERVAAFEKELAYAVKLATRRNAPMAQGDWCRWCSAKPTCPLFTGVIERSQKLVLSKLDAEQIGEWLTKVEMVEQWASDLKKLAFQMLEEGVKVPGWKMVAGKLSNRAWSDADTASAVLESAVRDHVSTKYDTGKWVTQDGAPVDVDTAVLEEVEDVMSLLRTDPKLVSPTQAEKVLKKHKISLPDELLAPRTSSMAMVPESDPRAEVLQVANRLRKALGNIAS